MGRGFLPEKTKGDVQRVPFILYTGKRSRDFTVAYSASAFGSGPAGSSFRIRYIPDRVHSG
jgi:hypothetical protein